MVQWTSSASRSVKYPDPAVQVANAASTCARCCAVLAARSTDIPSRSMVLGVVEAGHIPDVIVANTTRISPGRWPDLRDERHRSRGFQVGIKRCAEEMAA